MLGARVGLRWASFVRCGICGLENSCVPMAYRWPAIKAVAICRMVPRPLLGMPADCIRFKWRKMATALMADDAKGSGQPKPKELARCAKRRWLPPDSSLSAAGQQPTAPWDRSGYSVWAHRSLASIAAADIGMALAVDPKRVKPNPTQWCERLKRGVDAGLEK